MDILSKKGAGALLSTGAAALALAAFAAPQASASVSTCPTVGTAITGQGASLQGNAQSLWSTEFNTACAAFGASVAYTPNSSGTGLRAWGANASGDPVSSDAFIGTDDPPTDANIRNMEFNSGGRTRIIPVAQASVAVIVNLPANCSLTSGAAANIDNTALETAFRSGTSTFTNLLGSQVSGTGCNTAIQRVVRGSGSGTTYQFKNYLNTISAWTVDLSTTWPNSGSNLHLGTDTASGPLLVDYVNRTAGTIGYANLSDAVASFSLATSGSKFFARIQNNGTGTTGQTYASPQARSGMNLVANCANTVYTGVPSTTLSTGATWYNTSGANNAIGSTNYPACTLTYDVAYDDYSDAGGRSAAQANTVKGYLQYITAAAPEGQARVSANNYAPLPSAIRSFAATAAAAIRP